MHDVRRQSISDLGLAIYSKRVSGSSGLKVQAAIACWCRRRLCSMVFSFDGFPPFEYGRCSTEVDVGWRHVVQTLVVAEVVVVLDDRRCSVQAVLADSSFPAGSDFSSSGDIA